MKQITTEGFTQDGHLGYQRTYKELKLRYKDMAAARCVCYQRTYKELKHVGIRLIPAWVPCYQRTYKELKHNAKALVSSTAPVTSVPIRN